MRISDAGISYASTVTPLTSNGAVGEPINGSKKEQASHEVPRPSVFISGRSQMLLRVFGSEDPNVEPVIITERNNVNLGMPYGHFLNKGDRQLISEMYEYAQEQGADLRYVDHYVFSLASYRQDGKVMTSHNTGYDLELHKVTYLFTDKDSATISRIQYSEALKTTRVDKDFVRYQTDKDLGVISHPSFDFLERMINKFSAEGDKAPPLGGAFSSYQDIKNNYIRQVSTEVYKPGKSKTATDGSDVLAAQGKNKKKSLNARLATPETLRAVLRQIMAKAMGTGVGLRMRSLAEFLMRSGR
jgi:hypothetical protein